eukprot:CFRG0383T1
MGAGQSVQIPKTMKRLVLVETNSDYKKVKLEVTEVDVPTPKPGQVLVRMAAAPMNPSDWGQWLTDDKTRPPLPLGIEGSGVVVAANGVLASRLIGQSVGVVGRGLGTYAEYVAVDTTQGVWPMPADLPIEDAASFFVNPYTAYAIVDTAKQHTKGKKCAFIHTAAASQLGQMMVKLCKDDDDITLVNVVRRADQAKILTDIGAKHVIVTDEPDWQTKLAAKIKQLNVTVAFDAISGDTCGILMSLLPPKGHLFLYGGLSGQPANGLSPLDLIYGEKKMHGFLLNTWITKGGAPTSSKGIVNLLMRTRAASAKVNPGLKAGGWASSTFRDITLDTVQANFVDMKENGITGEKIRIIFPK